MSSIAACRCGARFQAASHLAGKQVRCPSCGQALTVPFPQPAAVAARSAAPIAVACRCGSRFQAQSHLAGRQVACPACRQPLVIPHASQAAAMPTPARNDDGFWDEVTPPMPPTAHDPWVDESDDDPDGDALPTKKDPPAPSVAMAHAIKRSARGASESALRDELMGMGVGADESDRIVSNLYGKDGGLASGGGGVAVNVSGGGATQMVAGVLLVLVGIGITVGTYLMAQPGGVYFVATGPMVGGAIMFFRGLMSQSL